MLFKGSACIAANLLLLLPVQAHDQWADGSVVPAWVKSACCGPQDAHMDPVLLHDEKGWRVEGNDYVIADDKVLPSEDGHAWVFYVEHLAPNATIYCLFLPQTTMLESKP
jgi:hypothetical protein